MSRYWTFPKTYIEYFFSLYMRTVSEVIGENTLGPRLAVSGVGRIENLILSTPGAIIDTLEEDSCGAVTVTGPGGSMEKNHSALENSPKAGVFPVLRIQQLTKNLMISSWVKASVGSSDNSNR